MKKDQKPLHTSPSLSTNAHVWEIHVGLLPHQTSVGQTKWSTVTAGCAGENRGKAAGQKSEALSWEPPGEDSSFPPPLEYGRVDLPWEMLTATTQPSKVEVLFH